MLGLSERQTSRLVERYRTDGRYGTVSKKRGPMGKHHGVVVPNKLMTGVPDKILKDQLREGATRLSQARTRLRAPPNLNVNSTTAPALDPTGLPSRRLRRCLLAYGQPMVRSTGLLRKAAMFAACSSQSMGLSDRSTVGVCTPIYER